MAIQSQKDKIWTDEAGNPIPYNRITKLEKEREKLAQSVLKSAKKVNETLIAFKEEIKNACEEAFKSAMNERNIKPDYKGNFSWYNFDRSIKIETSISDQIVFDELTIIAAKKEIDDFLDESIDSKIEFGKELAIDAFSTVKGNLDVKKVLNLLKWKNRVKSEKFQNGLNLIEEAIRRPSSKTYHRIYVRDEADNNKYKAIELNFSNI